MSVNGIGPQNLPATYSARPNPAATQGATQQATQQVAQQALQQARAQQAALKPQAPIAGQGTASQGIVPAEAPAGTDPALWSVLTTEERNFFAKSAALGPLTYGRIKAVTHPAPPTARGVRLDVRA